MAVNWKGKFVIATIIGFALVPALATPAGAAFVCGGVVAPPGTTNGILNPGDRMSWHVIAGSTQTYTLVSVVGVANIQVWNLLNGCATQGCADTTDAAVKTCATNLQHQIVEVSFKSSDVGKVVYILKQN